MLKHNFYATRQFTKIVSFILSTTFFTIMLIITGSCKQAPKVSFTQDLKAKLSDTTTGKIIPGNSGWLFFRPDVQYVASPIPHENINKIANFNTTLASQGITLFVVPVPTKVEIYPEKLTQAIAPSPVKEERNRFIDSLRKKGVTVLDLLPDFIASKSANELFEANESHWTPRGIALAASLIASSIDTALKSRNFAQNTHYTIADTVLRTWGDLRDMATPGDFHVPYSIAVPRVITQTDSGFYDDPTSGLLILGDSFVDRARWWHSHLGAHVSEQTHYPTRTFCSLLANTDGPCMYERLPRVFPKKGIVVWVFTSRVLLFKLCANTPSLH